MSGNRLMSWRRDGGFSLIVGGVLGQGVVSDMRVVGLRRHGAVFDLSR